MAISVALIEDEKDIRTSLQLFINGSEGFSCMHAYGSAEEALEEIPKLQIDVVLTDIHLPGISGIQCIAALIAKGCPANFMICSSFDDTENVFNALKAGATGYLIKTTPPAKLLDAITEIHEGGSPMNSHIARKVVLSFNQSAPNPELEKLSAREQLILELLSKGLRYKEIADRLTISTETVRTHIRNIYGKLQVNSRTDALNKIYGR